MNRTDQQESQSEVMLWEAFRYRLKLGFISLCFIKLDVLQVVLAGGLVGLLRAVLQKDGDAQTEKQ